MRPLLLRHQLKTPVESTTTDEAVVKETTDDIKADSLASPEVKPVIAAVKELMAQDDKHEAQDAPSDEEKAELEYQADTLVKEAQTLDAETEVADKAAYY